MSDIRSFNEWFEDNYHKCREVVLNITKNHRDSEELLHFVMTEILTKPPKKDIVDSQKLYFFIRLVKNNWYSKTSRYHYKFRKVVYNTKETEYDDVLTEIKDDVYDESGIPDIDWVRDRLQCYSWFDRDIFLLYIELNTIKGVSQQTTIPINSCSKYINNVKDKLQEDWSNKDKL